MPKSSQRRKDNLVTPPFVERGATRSGGRFAAANTPHHPSIKDLLDHHKRLLHPEPVVTTRVSKIGSLKNGSLLTTTIRFPRDYPNKKIRLAEEFVELFREHSEGPESGFEVVVTFNAILTNQDSTSFSVFFGQDFGEGNISGAAPQLRFGESVVVKTLGDVSKIPTHFDFEQLAKNHRHSFESSNVRVHSFLNVVYLVTRFFEFSTGINTGLRLRNNGGSRAAAGTSAQ